MDNQALYQFSHNDLVEIQKIIKASLNPKVEYSETPIEMSKEAYAIRGKALEYIAGKIVSVAKIPL